MLTSPLTPSWFWCTTTKLQVQVAWGQEFQTPYSHKSQCFLAPVARSNEALSKNSCCLVLRRVEMVFDHHGLLPDVAELGPNQSRELIRRITGLPPKTVRIGWVG